MFRQSLASGLLVLSVLSDPVAHAAQEPPLPDPLTLQHVLQLAEAAHPVLAQSEAALVRQQSEAAGVAAQQGLDVHLDINPILGRFAASPDDDLENDSRVHFRVLRQLTDFGRSRSLLDAAWAEVRHYEHLLTEVRLQRRIQVMQRFLEVLLADLKYNADDEEMTRQFTEYDRARERSELGMVSPVELLQLETGYREALIARAESDYNRRVTRSRLALVLNRPDAIVANLVRPRFAGLEREVPEYEQLIETALAQNPALKAMHEKVEAANLTVAAQRALRHPVLTGGVELSAWEQEVGSRHDVQLGLQLHVPIYQGGIDQAAIGKAQAELMSRQAELERAQLQLRSAIIELLRELDTLRTARRTAQTRLQYRELAADEARAKYELEIRTTLGQSLARLTEAEYLSTRDEFMTVLAWARLDALLGRSATLLAEQN